jgi:ParB-like chromosome segregation protein Spo0J
MKRFEATVLLPISSLRTSMEHVRCRHPALIDRMVGSLCAHGQLTPLVAVKRPGALEIVDGFKRLAAARRMEWPELAVSTILVDETTQWATMLALNRGPQSMSELEEALILRELVQHGLTQVQIGELVQRHKSWVSRRIGLVERLHPELVEGMKLGVLAPGIARRLLPLPPGNQLQLSTAAQSAGLGPRDTELLVGLWQKAKDPAVREVLLKQPQAALAQAYPELPRADPRLTPPGQQLSRLLSLMKSVAPRAARLLPPTEADLRFLVRLLEQTREAVCQLLTALGQERSAGTGPESVVAVERASS